MMTLLMAFVTLFLLRTAKGQSCDSNYDILPDLEHRDQSYVLVENGSEDFDGVLDGNWYCVKEWNMPNDPTNLKIGSCGTNNPVWMKGTVPNVEDGVVTRTVCIMSYDSFCSTWTTVEVRNCGKHMIYKLGSLKLGRYCFNKPTVFEEKAVTYRPEVKSHLTFVQATSDKSKEVFQNPKLFFSCEFARSNDETLFYQIFWFVNDDVIMTTDPMPYSELENTNLTEDELISRGFKLDIKIKCGVQDSASSFKEMTISPEFWAGIKILTPEITIKQGQIGEIQLQSTVPFGCLDRDKATKCILPIEVYDLSYDCEKNSISVMDSERCGTKFHGLTFQDWIDGKVFKWVAIIILTTKDIDDFNQNGNSYVFSLRTSHFSTANIIMNDNFVGDITVHVEAETAWVWKTCHAHIDPHMVTFDQKYYENQNLGEFVLYRHTSFKQEVQMKTYDCYGAKCACAASIRAGGELFIIDVCTSPGLIKHASCKEKIMIIQKINEYRYEIHMPLGTMVVVTIENWPNPLSSLNIDITPSVKDVGGTVGLCGKLNDDMTDDFITPSGTIEYDFNEFSISWRLDYCESFLNPSNHDPAYWEDYLYLCSCPFENDREPLCSPKEYLACTSTNGFPGEQYDDCNVISKRSRVSHTKEIRRILSKRATDRETYQERHTFHKRSADNYTTEKAKEICENIFKKRCVADSFKGLSNNIISWESAINDCTLDLVILGDLNLADIHCSSFTAEMERYIRKDSVLRSTHSSEVQSFYAKTCINNCNWHGNCVNGTCICHELYTEKDCSVSIEVPPDVLDTYSGGLCSTRDDECCGSVSIYGLRFVSGVTKQQIITFEVFANGKVEIQEKFVKDLQIINAFEAEMDVPCKSPEQRAARSHDISLSLAHGVMVSLSNDGLNYGAAQSFYVYDAKCQGFKKSISGYFFYILEGTCYIDGVCYSKDENSPSDVCKRCRPEKDPYSFTNVLECAFKENDVEDAHQEMS